MVQKYIESTKLRNLQLRLSASPVLCKITISLFYHDIVYRLNYKYLKNSIDIYVTIKKSLKAKSGIKLYKLNVFT